MRRNFTVALVAFLAALPLGCDGGKGDPAATGAPTGSAAGEATSASAAVAASSAPTPPTAATTATPTETAAVAPSGSPSATPATTTTASAKTTPTAAPSGSAAAGAKEFDCGAKGQKPCPMQGWMKSVMGAASSSGDGAKLAAALAYVAGRPPPGMGNWVSISNAGAAKAKAGDIEGAKASCKQCHDAYKASYKATMRDRPF